MRVAWIIGTDISLDNISSDNDQMRNSGGWNNTQLKRLYESDEIDKLTVISIQPSKPKNAVEKGKGITIYHLNYKPVTARVNNSLIEEIYDILLECRPDVLDIQGAENTYAAITFLKQLPCPVLITIHGIAYQCERFYTRGIPGTSLFTYRTLRDWLTFRGVFEKLLLMKKRADIEQQVLNSVHYVRGRTNWDQASILYKNPNVTYYTEELILREEFNKAKWALNKCENYRIFATQANSPLKSIYTVLETVSILKRRFDAVKLVIPGHVIRSGHNRNGYEKLVYNRIKKLGLEKNVIFTGNLDAKGMVNELLKARVFLLQSELENSPNSLAEAQMVGVPCVSSFTGGTPEYIDNGRTGFLYNSYDPVMAAMHIQTLFEDDNLCERLSKEERFAALQRHSGKNITDHLIAIYADIIEQERTEGKDSSYL